MAAVKKNKVFTYKDKPVIRKGKEIYYGNLEDKYILALKITETKQEYGMEIATKIVMELQDNGGELGTGKIYRKSERDDLYHAFDIGAFWLEDALDSTQDN